MLFPIRSPVRPVNFAAPRTAMIHSGCRMYTAVEKGRRTAPLCDPETEKQAEQKEHDEGQGNIHAVMSLETEMVEKQSFCQHGAQ